MVRILIPPTPGRRHPVDLLLCGHHYRESRAALATAKPGGIDTSGDPAVLGRLMSLIDNPDPGFAIVTP